MATLRISLRPGERIFVNGAVLKVDRKTTLEFLNDVTFLLESHVMQAEDATTPLRQLYFVVQMMIMDPNNSEAARQLFQSSRSLMLKTYRNRDIIDGLTEASELVERNRCFEALKRVRSLIPLEDESLGKTTAAFPPPQPERTELRLAAGGVR
ncbi:flagellar biosynthesis repressor FlbT [Aurantimonas sp. HBX-1]|uniref:flagellar biosynthesis repressor FlbT n=1 Tax=Aurantimonas sp. HBX-1 TaxID=2906072 RepID=UPI001F449627|nr:flagellar biosynthesis repressor FlbT [Aurantimonas sp. HBX-1]UIJ72894.1 flagellar biosynthesis repressor FlbT [Aurantimonas sp. HBX-1]